MLGSWRLALSTTKTRVFSTPTALRHDLYALTLGLNYRASANLIVRPEVRFDWDDDSVAGLQDGDNQETFGVDTIFLF